jgi:hypothetical protein
MLKYTSNWIGDDIMHLIEIKTVKLKWGQVWCPQEANCRFWFTSLSHMFSFNPGLITARISVGAQIALG